MFDEAEDGSKSIWILQVRLADKLWIIEYQIYKIKKT